MSTRRASQAQAAAASQEAAAPPRLSDAAAADPFESKRAAARYQAFSRLTATAASSGTALPIPELVAVGGQSDGKSSLLEALLGFKFNVVASEIGTRRPLIVRM